MQEINGVEIFSTGTWNGFKFVASDITELADNTNSLLGKGTHKPPVKLGHAKKQILKQDDGQPSLGWLQDFKANGDKLTATLSNIPEILVKSFKQKLYRQVSAELKFRQGFGWFVSGLALLGADLPAVKTLADLETYLSENGDTSSEETALAFSEPIIIKEPMSTDIAAKELEFKTKELELQAKLDKLEREKAELEKVNSDFSEKSRLEQYTQAKEALLEVYKKDVKEGRLTPVLFTELEKSLEAQQLSFSESKPLFIEPGILGKITDEYRKKLDLSETAGSNIGSGEPEAARLDETVVAGINKVMASSGKNYADASDIYFSANPKIADQYLEFSSTLCEQGV